MRLPDPQRSHAVLIGTGSYRSAGLNDIPHVANNLTALAQVLTSPALGGLPPERCITLHDPADAVTVARTLRHYADATQDTLLVYYSGHGLTTLDRGELFLGLPGTDEAELRLTALPFDTIRETVGRSPAANRVVILDCCYSGRAIREHLSSADQLILGQIGIEGTYILTSAPAGSIALYDTAAAHTTFTDLLLTLLRTGIPDGPELLALNNIYRRLLYIATTRGFPRPQRVGTGTTELLGLVRNLAHATNRLPTAGTSQRQLLERLKDGRQTISMRVLGQRRAVKKTLAILERAVLGLSPGRGVRPRAVLFFAGPTGVGKTEMARSVAGVLLGGDSEPLRFDMGDFSAEVGVDQLIGAPVGSAGYEIGGRLTAAVRRNPFQVVLFDEIEKAHPVILDKLLQIMENGLLTDRQGTTIDFSGCVLIFTSGLGVGVTDPISGRRVMHIDPDTLYDVIEARVRETIRQHFVEVLGRPELFALIRNNIVVFEFIDAKTAHMIFDAHISMVVRRAEEALQIRIHITPDVLADLCQECTKDMWAGGRSIGNALETQFINPLAQALLEHDIAAGSQVLVAEIRRSGAQVELELELGWKS